MRPLPSPLDPSWRPAAGLPLCSAVPSRVDTQVEAECESVLYASDSVLLGAFRCAPTFPRFRDAGRIRNYVVAFPRSAVWIARDGERPFVSDATTGVLHVPQREYERGVVSPLGDRTDWIAIPEQMARDIVAVVAPDDAAHPRVFRHGRVSLGNRLYAWQRSLFVRAATGSAPHAGIEEEALAIVAETIAASYAREAAAAGEAGARARRATRGRTRDLVEDAKALLACTMRENLGVAALGARLGVSPYHLCRTFRLRTGKTMHAHRRDLRLREALHLLREHRGDLSALALELGFSSHCHLTATFRGAYGVPPSQLMR